MSYIGKQPRKAALTSSDIEDGIITAAKIEDGAVVAAEIASNAVTTAKINADAVTAAKIADDVINSEHIAADSIDAEHYAAGSVDTTALGADAVTGAKIADDAINSEHYTDGSIDTAHLADGQVTTAKLATAVLTGATDIGAAIADADLFLVDDGAGGTLRKTAASRLKTYIGGGITQTDAWRITADTSTEGDITANWERSDAPSFGKIGSGVSQSSGIFSFPATGLYLVEFRAAFKCGSGTEYATTILYATINNSSYANVDATHLRIYDNEFENTARTQGFINCTNTSNVKVKFNWAGSSTNLVLQGDSDSHVTGVSFIRLGDSV